MESNMITEAEKIKKGCGIVLKLIHKCGEYYAGRVIYCDVCQARLSQYKSDLQQELEFLEGIKIECWQEPCIKISKRINFIKKELEDVGK